MQCTYPCALVQSRATTRLTPGMTCGIHQTPCTANANAQPWRYRGCEGRQWERLTTIARWRAFSTLGARTICIAALPHRSFGGQTASRWQLQQGHRQSGERLPQSEAAKERPKLTEESRRRRLVGGKDPEVARAATTLTTGPGELELAHSPSRPAWKPGAGTARRSAARALARARAAAMRADRRSSGCGPPPLSATCAAATRAWPTASHICASGTWALFGKHLCNCSNEGRNEEMVGGASSPKCASTR